MTSTLTKHQTRTYGPVPIDYYGEAAVITATVRFDDECGNGHNSFAITGEIRTRAADGSPRPGDRNHLAGGCLHGEIAAAFPELAPFIKWHLCATDGPMHYLANTLYWLGYDRRLCDGKPNSPPNLDHARSTAIWPDMPHTLLCVAPDTSGDLAPDALARALIVARRAEVSDILRARLAALLAEFRAAVESLSFTW